MQKGDTFDANFKITQEIYTKFIEIFHDCNPLHTDDEFAKRMGFKFVLMHGNILNGFLSYFIGELLPIKNVIIHSQEIKYLSPVYLNDSLHFVAKVMDVFSSVKVIELKFEFINTTEKKVATGKINIGIL